jgi:hypothetical protein
MSLQVVRKIHGQAGSYLIALPILWIRSKNLRSGDSVRVSFADKVTIEPVRKAKEAAKA